MVLTAAGSVEELYRFQAARLPSGDPDERMKLARWCLTEHLAAQAREQLLAIQQMCPDDNEVKRMLYNLNATAARPAVDPGFRLTSGEMPRGDAPASLDPRVVKNAQKRFNALPEIFDLPQAQAVKHANEFADFVQPVLQQSCVRCHNEKYQGEFQLVEIKARRDWGNSDIARANLDATLRLINPDDPARSELLSAGLVPHPAGSKNAIFKGPNDRNYQVLAIWSRSLRPARAGNTADRSPGDDVSRTGFSLARQRAGRRVRRRPLRPPGRPARHSHRPTRGRPRRPELPGGPPANPAARPPSPARCPPPRVMIQSYDEAAEFVNAPGDDPQFLTPFAVGGASSPRTAAASPRPRAGLPALPGRANAPDAAPSTPAVVPKVATEAGPNAVVVGPTDDPNELPGMNQPHYPPKAETDPAQEARQEDRPTPSSRS